MNYEEMWESAENANIKLVEKLKEYCKRLAAYESEPSEEMIKAINSKFYGHPCNSEKDCDELLPKLIKYWQKAVRDSLEQE